jgi:NAD(P)-dependent dehydrogenase (short-subunit alcohol dehydrogenase family)
MTRLLDGKVALVTGAGHGIGRGHALELAKHGATVIVNDLGTSLSGEGTGKIADEVVAIIENRGGTAVSDFSDVGDEEQVDLAVERAYSQLGRLDIVVNNAGIVRDKAIWNMTVDDFDLVMRVHVRGSWLTSRAVARKWREESKANGGKVYGRIINTTSGAGLHGHFGQTNYSTAKSAIVGLTQTLSLELASIGATVNAISPGGRTRMSASMPGAQAAIDRVARGGLAGQPGGRSCERPGDPRDGRAPSAAQRLASGRLGVQRAEALGCRQTRCHHGH